MNLKERIKTLDTNFLENFQEIYAEIQNYVFELEENEPEDGGFAHDSWEKNYDEFTEIAELAETIKEKIYDKEFDDEMDDMAAELKERVADYEEGKIGLRRVK